jgi:hypothetical protein
MGHAKNEMTGGDEKRIFGRGAKAADEFLTINDLCSMRR